MTKKSTDFLPVQNPAELTTGKQCTFWRVLANHCWLFLSQCSVWLLHHYTCISAQNLRFAPLCFFEKSFEFAQINSTLLIYCSLLCAEKGLNMFRIPFGRTASELKIIQGEILKVFIFSFCNLNCWPLHLIEGKLTLPLLSKNYWIFRSNSGKSKFLRYIRVEF